MNKLKLFLRFDVMVLSIFVVGLLTGIVLYYVNLPAFTVFIDEDGIAEWLTVVGLLACAVISIARFFLLRDRKKKLFLIFLLLTALVFIFGAGEEISWGQRIFGIESSGFFKEHNTQGEMNVHNLVFGGVKLNKLIFSLVLSVCVFLFLFILPVLYRKSEKIKKLVGMLAVPVPRNVQVIAYVVLFIVIAIIQDSRKWELLEMGGALLFLAIIYNPLNKEDFLRDVK